jgi:hypothetical protein
MQRPALLLSLMLWGCSGSNQCKKACDHLAECQGIDTAAATWTCPLSESCAPRERCQADCWLAASCEAFTGKDAGGARALNTCVAACEKVPAGDGGVPTLQTSHWYFPQGLEKDIDILFVIDNSNSMAEEQQNLSQNFPKLIEALRSQSLGNKIPNVHIGVITSDLGAGDYGLPSCEQAGGDRGKLQAQPRIAGCTPPSQSFISYEDGVTNIESATSDPIEQVKEAFRCIAEVGTGGCGFEQQLQAARRALDPGQNVNPGFVRKDALLAVVFITDEDDCSAQNSMLYDSNQTTLTDPLGPLTSFRCFEFGIECDINDRTKPGPRKSCKPAYDWLYSIDDYVKFFKGLKPPGRVMLFAVAGPTDKVEVGLDAQNPTLRPSCQTSMGRGVPAIRIKALVDGLGKDGTFNRGTDTSFAQDVAVNICSPDYSPALRLLGRKLTGTLGTQCLSAPLTTDNGGLVCQKDDPIGGGQVCGESCLEKADCVVKEIVNQGTAQESSTVVQQCPGTVSGSCGATCPCWRIVRHADCRPAVDGSPYRFEILRQGDAPGGAVAQVSCSVSQHKWGSSELGALPQCE